MPDTQRTTPAQKEFLRRLMSWQGVATTDELGPQTSQADNSARQTCKRRGWVTFDRYYWRITDIGRDAYRAMIQAAPPVPEMGG